MKWFRFVCLVPVFLFLSCSERVPEPPVSQGLLIGAHEEIKTLDPFGSLPDQTDNVIRLLFNRLVDYDPSTQTFHGSLAERWEVSADHREWTFYIRKDVKFHDGKKLTADDVLFSLGVLPKLLNNPVSLSGTKDIVRLEKLDDYTVKFYLAKPDQTFLVFLSIVVFIVPHHLFEPNSPVPLNPTEYYKKPVGSGPFWVKFFSPSKVVLEANKDYFLGPPKLHSITFENFENDRVRFAKLLRREVDIVSLSNHNHIRLLQNVPYIKQVPYSTSVISVLFNFRNPLFKPVAVRQAFNYLINKERAMNWFFKEGNTAIEAATVVPPQYFSQGHHIDSYGYNPRRALELLESAGWKVDLEHYKVISGPNGDSSPEVEFAIIKGTVFEKIFEMIRYDLALVGIVAKAKLISWDSAATGVGDPNDQSLFLTSYPYAYGLCGDVSFWRTPEDSNLEGIYKNQKVDDLLDRARFTASQEESQKAYSEFQQVMHDDPPMIYLFWQQNPMFYNSRVKNLSPNSDPSFRLSRFNEVYVDGPRNE